MPATQQNYFAVRRSPICIQILQGAFMNLHTFVSSSWLTRKFRFTYQSSAQGFNIRVFQYNVRVYIALLTILRDGNN